MLSFLFYIFGFVTAWTYLLQKNMLKSAFINERKI